MKDYKYWIIQECSTGIYYYYCGYYETGKPVFNMAIADALHIASLDNAKMIYKILNPIVPCDILVVEKNLITKVFPL
ncbi:hypothetical protein [Mucilaginibacter sp. dw_454]|uniref:hypothetical protein n=1 Tax=Mucilaginibacter sp. dw_454 TaxID=2720079 RepID=UPI001BD5A7F0|nr:hypothetical protein [Mucilaginibacter sp. dw_454]